HYLLNYVSTHPFFSPSVLPPPPSSTLFPYTTLFRSCHLPFHESINTIEVLPMAIRGLYVEGWELRNNSPRLTTVDDFVQEVRGRSEEHTSELQSRENIVCRLLLEKKNTHEL